MIRHRKSDGSSRWAIQRVGMSPRSEQCWVIELGLEARSGVRVRSAWSEDPEVGDASFAHQCSDFLKLPVERRRKAGNVISFSIFNLFVTS